MTQDTVLTTLTSHLQGWWGVVTALLCLAGFAITVVSVASIARRGGAAARWGAVAFALAAGVLLLNLPGLLDSLAYSLFGHGSVQGLSYSPPEHAASDYVRFAIHLLALVGLVGLGRGVLLLKDAPDRPGQMGRALTHIAGGILCVNFPATLKIIARSLGTDVVGIVAVITG
ncbi:MAG: hypothetical protein LBT40_16415 [Deltaproteobacteria bacterium]|jgi:hypothetical protein|nr:hypothetical protein [Deltaproteobacteria bacterium]